MLMIPITFLPVIALAILASWLAINYGKPLSAPWLIIFLLSLALQLLLVGVRYGYGIHSILSVQHITGVLVPPLAFLAFNNPKFSRQLILHLIPIIIMGLTVFYAVFYRHSFSSDNIWIRSCTNN